MGGDRTTQTILGVRAVREPPLRSILNFIRSIERSPQFNPPVNESPVPPTIPPKIAGLR